MPGDADAGAVEAAPGLDDDDALIWGAAGCKVDWRAGGDEYSSSRSSTSLAAVGCCSAAGLEGDVELLATTAAVGERAGVFAAA